MEERKKQRIVIKIGSSSLANHDGGLSRFKLNHYVEEMTTLIKNGHEVILVSSGAVAAGFKHLGYLTKPSSLEGKQAAAAIGQGLLIQAYNEAFQQHQYLTAQILITRHNFSNREQYNNAYRALMELLKRRVIPIINENDTVAIEELTFGDNDMLSALVAGLIHADQLIILTDIDGLYDKNPNLYPDARRFSQMDTITPEIEKSGGKNGSPFGTGGMYSKVAAAKMALSLGVHVFIGKGDQKNDMLQILSSQGRGTYFGHSNLSTVKSKKQWIAFHSETNGKIIIDQGAAMALIENGKSLLPAGLIEVIGVFEPKQVIEVFSKEGILLGKGLVNYSSEQLRTVMGYSSELVKQTFEINRTEVIHRDDWIALYQPKEEVISI